MFEMEVEERLQNGPTAVTRFMCEYENVVHLVFITV